jgi:hypothetical protein
VNSPDEHDDDLEPEVLEGADIETVTYQDDETGESEPWPDRTHSSGRVNEEADSRVVHDDSDDHSSDTI